MAICYLKVQLLVVTSSGTDMSFFRSYLLFSGRKYTASGFLNDNVNVEPNGDYQFSAHYYMDYNRIRIEGPNGGPILVDVPFADVPKWLGGQLLEGFADSIVTVLPYSELHSAYTPLAPGIPNLPPIVDRELHYRTFSHRRLPMAAAGDCEACAHSRRLSV